MRCSSCGLELAEGQEFHQATTLAGKIQITCPNCQVKRQRRLHAYSLIGTALLGLSGAILIRSGIDEGLGRIFLGVFWIQACLVLSIVPHELGHALVARWVGLTVQSIVVGSGRPVWRGKFLSFDWIIRRFPYGGATIIHHFADGSLRLRRCMYILAGPAANFLQASVAWVLLSHSAFHKMEGSLVTNGWWIFIWTNLFVAVHNLYPAPVGTPLGVIPSDGLALLLLLRNRSKEEVEVRLKKARDSMPLQAVRLKYISWGVITTVIGGGSLVLAVLVGYLSVKDPALKSVTLVMVILVGAGLVLLWFAIGCWKQVIEGGGVKSSGTGRGDSSAYRLDMEAYQRELGSLADWPTGFSPGVFMMEVSRLDAANDLGGQEHLVADTIRSQPENLLLKVLLAEVMEKMGKLTESAETYASVAALNQVPTLTRFVLRMRQCILMARLDRIEEVRVMLPGQLREPVSAAAKSLFLDSLACLPMTHGIRSLIPDAFDWVRQARELDPGSITLQGTEGMLQFESDHWEDAETTLQKVLANSEADNDIGISSLYLALCEKKRGNLVEAHKLGRRARITHPEPWLLERLSNELPDL